MSRTVIIDGDIVVFKAACTNQVIWECKTSEDSDFIYREAGYGSKYGTVDCFNKLILKIIKKCNADNAVICLSDREGNFRKDINPKYKMNRAPIKPILFEYLRDYVQGQKDYKVYLKPKLEADDVIGILATTDGIIKDDKVVWSSDKDFKTIPCKYHKSTSTGRDESIVITESQADWWFMYQTLIGDPVDGYKGCKGVGAARAEKLLGKVGEKSLAEMWDIVKTIYEKAGMSKDDALMNARMARILRAEDYDFTNKAPKLWKL